ncbi:MAG: hypothetical protein WC586_04930 [Methanoregula sp.]
MRWNDFIFFPGVIIEFLGVVVLVAGGITGKPVLLIAGVVIICIGSALTIIRIIRRARKGAGSPDPGIQAPADAVSEKPVDSTVLYQDHLVSISGNSITFHHYSFPLFLSDRQVYFRDIVRIDVKKTALGTGKWRIAGSGDFRTWFPMDWDRPSRDRTFFATMRAGWWKIGFTVENSSRVLSILKGQGLPIVESGE